MASCGLLRLRSVWGHFYCSYTSKKCVLRQCIDIQHRSVLRSSNLSKQVSKTDLLNSKASSEKDKLLFYCEQPGFFRIVNTFGFIQYTFWILLSEFMYNKMKDIWKVPDVENLPWWRKINFENHITRTIASVFCIAMGTGILSMCWLYTSRSVRMLVLRKGGKTVSIATYSPLGKNKIIEVPLEKMSTDQTRATAKAQLPIKVQDKWFYFILDTKNGIFRNPELFDYTAGMKRTLKQ